VDDGRGFPRKDGNQEVVSGVGEDEMVEQWDQRMVVVEGEPLEEA